MSREWKVGDCVSVPVPTWNVGVEYWQVLNPDDRIDIMIVSVGRLKGNYNVAAFPLVEWTASMWFKEPQDVFSAWVKEVRQEDLCSK